MAPGATTAPEHTSHEPTCTPTETVTPASINSNVTQGAVELSSCVSVLASNNSRYKPEESCCSPTRRLPSSIMEGSSEVDFISSSTIQCELKDASSDRPLSVPQGSKKEAEEVSSSCSLGSTVISSQKLVLRPAAHHQQEALCVTRPRYRQGRKLTAVKVYTVADESVYLLINGVPSISLIKELKNLCLIRGNLLELKTLNEYPKEVFTDVFIVKYENLRQARSAKKFLDGRNFFGGLLHVCYAPELETIEETRNKLVERRVSVNQAIARNENFQGPILAQYHPQDKLSASVKRISNRLKCDDDILQLNLEHMSARSSANLEIGGAGTLKTSEAEAAVGDLGYREQSSNSISVAPLQSSKSSCGSQSVSAANPKEVGSRTGLSKEQFNSALDTMNHAYSGDKVYTSNPRLSELHCKNSEESFQRNGSSETHMYACHPPSVNGPELGHTYSSMSADYEPGIGRISGERYKYTNSLRDVKNVDKNSSGHPRAAKKGWVEISNEIKRKKRKVQPRLSRLDTQKFDGCCKTSKEVDKIRRPVRTPSSRTFQFLEAIRAAASASFGPVPATAVRKVVQRQTPKISIEEGVKLL
ncbi:RNA recognition motif domain [Trinorchestia longiramus]|nr:RNA recognition motif domain [Trinorchestia longiramus]